MAGGITRRSFARRTGLGLGLASAALALPAVGSPRETTGQRGERTRLHNARVLAGLFDVSAVIYPWQRIVVHHTATRAASLAGIDRYHRNHFGDPLGAEYHFVINNGRKLPVGWIEVARWRYQEPAWHLFHPERAPNAIAICLVGNFEETELAEPQLSALVDLSAALMQGLAIDADDVTTHRGVDGILTQCPGRHFPRERYLKRLREQTAAARAQIGPDQSQARTPVAGPSLRCFP